MKKEILVGIAVLAIAVMTVFNISLNTDLRNDRTVLVLANIEALANELPDVEITCDTKGWGKCYYTAVEEGLFGACRFDCEYNGITTSFCHRCWVGLLNFCSAFAVACGG